LRLAIDQGELVLHYQPKICITDGKLRGVEALVRWLHPRRGLLPPSDFLPMAEESGLILALGDWVLDEACRQAAAWQAQGESICIAVNVSARQLVKGDLVGRVKELTALHGIPATALQIELTETALMVDPVKAIETLGSLREMGMGIAVDDFGTGYSSLSRLRSLPIDLLKIDRSFVMNAEHDARDAQVVRTIIALAQNLGLEVVAEGVESEAHASMLKDSGCTVCQGYHYGHPQSASQLEAFLRRQA
jgi:EAL domain-containing protein (putative c-di-GMP-specific phosphodiesterase class I)